MWIVGLCLFCLFGPWLLGPFAGRTPEMTPFKIFLQGINVTYCVMMHRLSIDRVAPLPATGGAILISNHTCGIDNMLLQAGSRRVLRFMIAREWYEKGPARPFCLFLGCIPVKRDGNDFGATRAALRTIEQGNVLGVFPEGKITPESGRVIDEGKPGAAFLAMKSRVPIIPAYIQGTPETEDVLKAMRTPSNARVFFGEPIPPSALPQVDRPDQKTLDQVTELLMSSIRALRDKHGPDVIS